MSWRECQFSASDQRRWVTFGGNCSRDEWDWPSSNLPRVAIFTCWFDSHARRSFQRSWVCSPGKCLASNGLKLGWVSAGRSHPHSAAKGHEGTPLLNHVSFGDAVVNAGDCSSPCFCCCHFPRWLSVAKKLVSAVKTSKIHSSFARGRDFLSAFFTGSI